MLLSTIESKEIQLPDDKVYENDKTRKHVLKLWIKFKWQYKVH